MMKTLLTLALTCRFLMGAPDTVDANWAGTAGSYFDSTAFGGPASMFVQPDGKLLLGSNWMSAQNGTIFLPLTRFNLDGTVDETFHADATPDGGGSGIFYDFQGQPEVHGLAMQSDGKIIAVGCMQGMRDGVTTAGSTKALISNGIVRITPDGDPDTTFQSAGIDTEFIDEVITLPNDKIIIAGGFNRVRNQGGSFVTRYGVARLNVDGSLDTSFNVNPADFGNIVTNTLFIRQVAPAANGKLYVVGNAQPVGGTFFDSSPVFARLNSDGSLDASFAPSYPSTVTSFFGVVVEPDGKIVVLGSNGNTTSSTSYMNRFTTSGASDGSFTLDSSLARVSARPLRRGPLGRYLLFKSDPAAGNTRLVRINTNGSLDPSFEATGSWTTPPFGSGPANAFFNQAMASPTGKIYAGGGFDVINGVPTVKIVAFEGDEVPNSPGTIQLAAAAYSATEADGSLLIPVVRTGGATGAASVSFGFSTALGNATAGADFDATGGTVSFAAGEAGIKYISVPLVEDSLVETLEVFTVNLSNATGAAMGGLTQGFATIIDSNSPPIIIAQPLPIFVPPFGFFQLAVGAISGKDPTTYQWFKGGVAIPGATSPLYFKTNVSAANDDGEYCVVVTNPNGFTTSEKVDVVVKNPAQLSFTASTAEAVEDAGSVTLTISRTGSSVNAVSVDLSLSNNSASSADYAISPQTITWADGESADKTVTVTLSDDVEIESPETFIVTLVNYSPDAVPGATTSLTFTILDDDSPLVITTQPTSRILQEDESVTLSVAASSQSPLSYQWFQDGEVIPGATGAALLLDPIGLGGAGNYTVEITNAAGTVTSDPAVIEVTRASYLATTGPPVPDLDLAVYSIALIDNQTAWVSGNSSTLGQVIQKVSLKAGVEPVTITLSAQADQVIVLPGGGVAARGFFTTVNGQSQSYVARFNAAGELTGGQIVTGLTTRPTSIAVDDLGRLLVAEGGSDLRRFDSNGSVDGTFAPVSFGSNASIESLAVAGGSIFVGGRFTSSGAGTAGNYLTKLNSDGSLDESFTYGTNRTVKTIIPLSNGRVAVLNQPSFGAVSHTVNFLSAVGVVEQQFSSLGNLSWFDFGVDDNDFVYAPRINGAMLTRLIDDGDFNANFGGFDASVTAIEVDEAGRVWVGGLFSTLGGQPVSKLVILNGEPGELAIIEDPALVAVEPGASATFQVNAVSSGTLAYQWRKDGSELPGQTGPTLTIDPVAVGNAGFYDVVVTNTDTLRSLTSEEAELVVLGAPEVRQSPPSATLIAGQDLTLEVKFFAREPATFQWKKNGVDLPGEINSSLELLAGQLGNSGSYTLVITNSQGNDTSIPANIQFIPDPAGLVSGFVPPTTSNGYPDYLVPAPDGGALLGGAALTGGLTRYLDLVDASGLPDDVFSPATATSSDGRSSAAVFDSAGLPIVVGNPRGFGFLINGNYRNVVKLNADGTLNEPFTTTVASQTGFDYVATDSIGRLYLVGVNKMVRLNADGTLDGTFSASFIGTPKKIRLDALERPVVLLTTGLVRYQTDGSLDSSFTQDPSISNSPAYVTFAISPDGELHLAAANSGRRRIYRLADDGSLRGALENPGYRGDFNLYDMAVQVNGKYLIADGSSIGLNRILPDGSADPLWQIGSGFNSVVRVVELTEDGAIWVAGQFSQFKGSPHFGYALLNGDPVDVIITSQPMSLTADSGTSGSLSIAANGFDGAPVVFQWQKDGVSLPGETGTTLTFASLTGGDGGVYEVVITNTVTGRERRSASAVVTVLGAPELVAYTDEAQDLEIDDELLLSVEVVGAATLSYQWQKNGDDIPGATNQTFSIPATVESNAGDYRVIVSNAFGTLTTETVAVSVVFSPAAINAGDPGLIFNSIVETVLPLADGRTLVGGSFSAVNSGGINYNVDELALLNADGTLDTGFDLNPSGAVYALAMDSDGGILVGGRFTTIGGQSKARVARLNPDLTLDATFGSNVGPNGDVYSFEATGDGRYYVGGIFTSWNGQPGFLVRLDGDGLYDSSFAPPALNTTEKVIPLPGGKVIAAGGFSGNGATRIARFNEDGSLDTTLPIGSNRYLFDVAVQPDGKIVTVGQFGWIVRYNVDGTQDTDFQPTASSSNIRTIAIDASGKILIGGSFSMINGEETNSLVRLNPDGTTDESFNVKEGVTGSLEDIVIQPLGKIWIGGGFTSYRGKPAGRLTLLNGNPLDLAIVQGPVNAVVNPGTSATFSVSALGTEPLSYQWFRNGAPLSDGGDVSGATLNTLTIANAEDADEDSYEVVVTHSVTMETLTSAPVSLVVLGAPEILSQAEDVTTETGLAATFSVVARGASTVSYQWYLNGDPLSDDDRISGATTPELSITDLELTDSGSLILRITNGLGTLDSNPVSLLVEKRPASRDRSVILPTFNSTVRALSLGDDGSFVAGGNFSTITHPNGSSGLLYLARILPDGTPDPDFAQVNTGSIVQTIDRDQDGRYLVAGGFTRLRRGAEFPVRNRVARINLDGSVDSTFDAGVGPNNTVEIVKALPDGKVLIGGNFTSVANQAGTAYVARLNADGTVDTGFVSQATGSVKDIALVGNDYWLSGGSSYDGNIYHVRVDDTGAVVDPFSYDGSMTVDKLIPTSDGGVVLGADSYPYIQKVDATGLLDATWPNLQNGGGPNNRVYEMTRLGNDRSVIAGTFSNYSGTPASNIMVVDENGAPEPDFVPGAGFNGNYPNVVKIDSLGRIWCGGSFTSYNGEIVGRVVVLNGYDTTAIDPFDAYVADLPVGKQGEDDDADGDGVSNLFEFAYGTFSDDRRSRPWFSNGTTTTGSAEINTLSPGSNLPDGENYYTVVFRFPDDPRGVALTPQATLNLANFEDGSAQLTAFGDPVDDGDYYLQRYYFTPGRSTITRGFIRLKASR